MGTGQLGFLACMVTLSLAQTDPCAYQPCQNGGVCESKGTDSFSCKCPSTHSGVLCQAPVTTPAPYVYPECKDFLSPGLSCADLNDPCNDSLGLATCPKFCGVCNDLCNNPNACLNGGKCSPKGTTYTCECPGTHVGLICETTVCNSESCLNGGTCVQNGTSYTCQCPASHTGNRCQISTKVPSSCRDNLAPPLTCATLDDPCSNAIGQLTCPKYCGLCSTVCRNESCDNGGRCVEGLNDTYTCQCPEIYTGISCERQVCRSGSCQNGGKCVQEKDSYRCECPSTHSGLRCHISELETTTTTTTTTTTVRTTADPNCPQIISNSSTIGCTPAEVIFLIEYARSDTGYSIDHEGDYIKEIIERWRMDQGQIRVGVVLYHDTVTEAIHLKDYEWDYTALSDRISRVTRSLRPSGSADLGQALDFVRMNSFTDARPGVQRIVIPIVHDTPTPQKLKIVPAATRLKDDCAAILGITVYSSDLDYDIIKAAVSKPENEYYKAYQSFNDLENSGKYFYRPHC